MKKTLLMALGAAAVISLASCSNDCKEKCNATDGKTTDEVLYSGILPSADAQASVYTLRLDYSKCGTKGDYQLVENTLAADTTAASSLKEVVTSYTEGDFTCETKVVNGDSVKYIKLVPDAKDALGGASSASNYFVVNADNSLTMTGEDLVKSETPGLNYTLTRK